MKSESYTTRELDKSTWPDFEKLFVKHNGVWGGCWCMYYHSTGTFQIKNHALENKRAKKRLVNQGKSHGIIVYENNQPIGWCQYGSRRELPRTDASKKYQTSALGSDNGTFWRITCFFVDRNNRRRGVGRIALDAALDSIKKKGGGLVEAYPVSKPAKGSSLMWPGTQTMFEKAGFDIVAPFGKSHVIVRMKI